MTIEEKTTQILDEIGVPSHIKGYQYLRDAILLQIEDSENIYFATKILYPTVAKKNQATASRVESAIRHAIEIAWDRGDVDILNSYFGYTIQNNRGKPTPTEFIAMLADHLCLQTENDPLKTNVTKSLNLIGVPADIKGRNYLRDAILLTINDSELINNVTKILYPTIARKYQATTSRVESTIRHAIEVAWDRGDVDILNSYFGYTIQNTRGKPTPTEFIATIADDLIVRELNDPMTTNATKILHQIGVPADIKGYQYLRTAILLPANDPELINNATKILYPTIARKYQATTSRVESAIRHAIEVAWDRGNVDILNSYFGYTIQNNRGKPTPTEFITMIADNIK